MQMGGGGVARASTMTARPLPFTSPKGWAPCAIKHVLEYEAVASHSGALQIADSSTCAL